jgi:hypothetical protein
MSEPADFKQQTRASKPQLREREKLFELFSKRPMSDEDVLTNTALFTRASVLAKQLWLNELYTKILPIPGIVVEFGVWWGQTLAMCSNLRAIYEPYNHVRKVVGFDTFTGYSSFSEKDSRSPEIQPGGYSVGNDYPRYLEELLSYHERENVLGHLRKFELVAGDVTATAPAYFERHPETIVALAIFDLALYEPTKKCLEAIVPHLVRGSIVAFDQLGAAEAPGETLAFSEVCGSLRRYAIHRSQFLPDRCYVTIE